MAMFLRRAAKGRCRRQSSHRPVARSPSETSMLPPGAGEQFGVLALEATNDAARPQTREKNGDIQSNDFSFADFFRFFFGDNDENNNGSSNSNEEKDEDDDNLESARGGMSLLYGGQSASPQEECSAVGF